MDQKICQSCCNKAEMLSARYLRGLPSRLAAHHVKVTMLNSIV